MRGRAVKAKQITTLDGLFDRLRAARNSLADYAGNTVVTAYKQYRRVVFEVGTLNRYAPLIYYQAELSCEIAEFCRRELSAEFIEQPPAAVADATRRGATPQ